ncbi:MAG: hypothetical protein ABMA13_16115 [Chthoniobacteraceae bacterium]
MSIDLEERRDQMEREAREDREAIRDWLALARIAVPCVLRTAADGNVRCIEAAREMEPLLAKRRGQRR